MHSVTSTHLCICHFASTFIIPHMQVCCMHVCIYIHVNYLSNCSIMAHLRYLSRPIYFIHLPLQIVTGQTWKSWYSKEWQFHTQRQEATHAHGKLKGPGVRYNNIHVEIFNINSVHVYITHNELIFLATQFLRCKEILPNILPWFCVVFFVICTCTFLMQIEGFLVFPFIRC